MRTAENCPECNGSGEIEKNIHRGEEGMQIEMDVMVVCPFCGGDGRQYFSCCGDDVKGTLAEDFGICPTCKEHLSGESEDCDECGGTGKIKIDNVK